MVCVDPIISQPLPVIWRRDVHLRKRRKNGRFGRGEWCLSVQRFVWGRHSCLPFSTWGRPCCVRLSGLVSPCFFNHRFAGRVGIFVGRVGSNHREPAGMPALPGGCSAVWGRHSCLPSSPTKMWGGHSCLPSSIRLGTNRPPYGKNFRLVAPVSISSCEISPIFATSQLGTCLALSSTAGLALIQVCLREWLALRPRSAVPKVFRKSVARFARAFLRETISVLARRGCFT